jgi:hypothetical protein
MHDVGLKTDSRREGQREEALFNGSLARPTTPVVSLSNHGKASATALRQAQDEVVCAARSPPPQW